MFHELGNHTWRAWPSVVLLVDQFKKRIANISNITVFIFTIIQVRCFNNNRTSYATCSTYSTYYYSTYYTITYATYNTLFKL